MPLETGTYIRDLNASNPGHTDQLNQNDGHLRFIKSALLATFPNFTSGPINSTQAAIDAAVASITGAASTAIRFFAGTAALPGITPATDTDTGLYAIAEDTLGISVNGARAVQLNPDKSVEFVGNVAADGALAVSGAYSGGTGQLMPLGMAGLWFTDTLPAGNYAWVNGQAISRTTYAPLFAMFGTAHGAGDGSTTFNLPDLRERVPVAKSTMGGTATQGILSGQADSLGAKFGEGKHTLLVPELPVFTPSGLIGGVQTLVNLHRGSGANIQVGSGSSGPQVIDNQDINGANFSFTGAPIGGNTPHNNAQPSFVCTWVMRIA